MANTRQLTALGSLKFFFSLLFWLPLTFFSLLLVYNTLPYFSFNPDFSFLQERIKLFVNPIWKYSFYIHIAAGAFCITTALVQFSSYILKKRRGIHIYAGRIYVFVVLVLGAPTGFYMAFFAKGGYWEKACFLFMAIFWFLSTYKGLQHIRNKNVLAHSHWMVRSYSMALTAVTFRIYHILFFYSGLAHFDNYSISLWISVLGNMLFAEYIIYRQSKPYLKTIKTETL
ncbi:MAG: DUF2306 domain-containing protein [Chitinophagales bacterium]|nr:DUF2306 domain-containing protein [Chitinophagales bacterium]